MAGPGGVPGSGGSSGGLGAADLHAAGAVPAPCRHGAADGAGGRRHGRQAGPCHGSLPDGGGGGRGQRLPYPHRPSVQHPGHGRRRLSLWRLLAHGAAAQHHCSAVGNRTDLAVLAAARLILPAEKSCLCECAIAYHFLDIAVQQAQVPSAPDDFAFGLLATARTVRAWPQRVGPPSVPSPASLAHSSLAARPKGTEDRTRMCAVYSAVVRSS
ncbi:hypothetical protein MCP1_40022 [Candidatus Terasakiella magnetica]|nr:hypothetical protein MCP1_40022 [Candidatus Terasakiella magnetica]